jgi:hypothetical protein
MFIDLINHKPNPPTNTRDYDKTQYANAKLEVGENTILVRALHDLEVGEEVQYYDLE